MRGAVVANGLSARHLSVLCLLACCLAGQALAQSTGSPEIAANVVLEDRYPQREHRFPNGVTGLPNLVFATNLGYRPLQLDLYLPPPIGTAPMGRPLVVAIHGGGWQSGHTRHFGAFANWPEALAAIAAEGFVVASVEYRLSGEAPFPAAFDDVLDAIRWLRANAATYGIDKSRAVVFGGSAGGQLAALVGTACGETPNPGITGSGKNAVPAESACIQGVVAWYGVFDFEPLAVGTNAGAAIPEAPEVIDHYLDCNRNPCNPETVRSASPINWIDSSDPPFLLVHGTNDQVVAVQQSQRMHAALESAGVNSTLIEIPGVNHSFIGASQAETAAASTAAWRATTEFFRDVLAKQPTDVE